ncbi:ABC transporter ATP-binding protein [Streptomyces durbertensis]|uniref:ABC transporter ATP-binding protein n=1 Tax=Streptomyces durbertensis TaxID=2448886 RepID=A0ABR6EAJ1_9ACTN|nr:ABC transporter ATP-binding protein [Streptomyces durbertensis]MBB1242359.1 ABC transporter ATP-binding protein [Streptomyces durbertensis]
MTSLTGDTARSATPTGRPEGRADTAREAPAGHRPGARPGRGALRRVGREGRPFLRARRGALWRLAGWSLVEFAQTFLTGYGVAQALDRGFLAGRPGVGLLWLAVAAVAALPAAVTTRGLFGRLADLVEPLRDGLVRRAARGALTEALAAPERAHTGAVSRATHQTEIARDGWAGLVMAVRSCLFTSAGALAGLATLQPSLLLVVLPPLLAGWTLFLLTLAPMAARQRAYLEADEAFAARAGELVGGLRDIRATGGAEQAAAPCAALADAQCDAARSLARWAAVRMLALGVAGRCPPLVLLAATPWLLSRGMTAGVLLGALAYLTQSLAPATHALMTALGTAGGRLLVVLDRFTAPTPPLPPPHTPQGETPDESPGEPPHGDGRPRPGGIVLREVTFAYGPGARPVLDRLDLTVRPGEHLAVLGPSGTGKSTLAALLAGSLTPDSGSLRWDDRPAPDRLVLLPQEPYVFTGTVADNLRYLHPAARDAELAAAIEAIGLAPLVERLGGVEGTVDPGRLSAGERQLLTLARAFLAPAAVRVLDEATCHLEPAAEARAERALAARPGTLVVIAHRPASAHRADRILLLDGTRVQQGTAHELHARSALFRDLTGQHSADEAEPDRS